MGTSKSYGGPKDRVPLLPPWAFPDTGEEQPPPENPVITPQAQPPAPPTMDWRSAKRSLGQAISSGSKSAFSRAGRNYVRALGGSNKAATTSGAGRAATAALGRFVASVGTGGINAALQSLGLASVVGKDVETVFAAISNALAPPVGASREGDIARRAINDALEALYEQYFLEDGDITKLDQMSPEEIKSTFETVVSAYIYNRWLGELELVIEKKVVSVQEAVRLERDMKQYVRECVRLDLKNVDLLTMNWNDPLGQEFVERIFIEAYSLLEGAE